MDKLNKSLFALTPLDPEFQVSLASNSDMLETLAVSPHLHPAAANRCLGMAVAGKVSASPSTCWKLIKRVDDVDLLDSLLADPSSAKASAAARNPHAPGESIERCVRRLGDKVMLAAMVNPATPLEFRRELAVPGSGLISLVNVGPALGHTVVRAAEVVLNNPWISADVSRFSPAFHRAVICSPAASLEEVLSASECSRSGRKFVASHPLVREKKAFWEGFTLQELLAFRHPASDIVALSRPEMSAGDAACILGRPEPIEPEPQVVARVFRRFGFLPVALQATPLRYAGSRISSSAWAEACVGLLDGWGLEHSKRFLDASSAADLLVDDPSARESFAALLPSWGLGFVELAKTARRLYR